MLVSFKAHRVQTSANTTITPANIIGARLVSTTSADVVVHLHDTAGATSASTRIGTLLATNFGADEIGYPTRVISGTLIATPVVAAGGTTATLYVYVR